MGKGGQDELREPRANIHIVTRKTDGRGFKASLAAPDGETSAWLLRGPEFDALVCFFQSWFLFIVQ